MRRSLVLRYSLASGISVALIALSAASPANAAAPAAPSVTTGSVSAVSPNSVTVSGSVNPNGASTTWYVEYGPSGGSGFPAHTSIHDAGAGTVPEALSASLSGLSPATTYRYRFVATNSSGSVDGTAGIVNTTAAPAVVTSAASQLSASGATLNGIVNPEGATTSWYFEYGLTTSYGSRTSGRTLAQSPNNFNVSAKLSSLAPRSTYHYRIVASSVSGTTRGADAQFTTGLSVTLNTSTSEVVYGGLATLSGKVASGHSGVAVTLLGERFDQSSYSALASVSTTNGGYWSYQSRPVARTSFEASAEGGVSSPVLVGVRPAVFLSVLRSGSLLTRVVAATSFGSHVLQLQRLSHGLWATWKSVRLNSLGKAHFSTVLPIGRTTIRMAIGPFVPGIDQASPGYLAGFSRSKVYVRQ